MPQTSQQAAIAERVRRLFSKPIDLITTYNWEDNYKIARQAREILLGKECPTIIQTDITFGEETSRYWLKMQIIFLSEYCGFRTKVTPYQYNILAEYISGEYGYLKLTELMWFFSLAAQGRLGRIGYDAFDPQLFNDALAYFVKNVRGREIEKIDAENLERQYEQAKRNAVPCPPHIREKWEAAKELRKPDNV